MNRAVFIFGGLVLLCGATWYVLKSRVRPPNTGQVVVTEQVQPQAPTTPPDTPESASASPPANPSPTHPNSLTPPSVPSTDTIPRNPPNGMIFAGTGKYQLYRQGDITWRLDTDTGWACILFATEAQWAKSRVYDHGCATPQTVSR
jgi:hypothetical protein